MIIVITGPTGVGKTKLSIELAKYYDAEIINADSMQVYKGLDIGTAKVTEEEKENIPHHLFDICEVHDIYTVYDYQRDCRNKIAELESRGKNIILVGGTGLYIKAALYDYRFKKEEELNEYNELSNQEIIDKIKLYNVEPCTHINNRRRLIRQLNKLEFDLNTENTGNIPLYDFKIIGLSTDRNNLYNKINNRVDKMVNDGLILEVESFYKKGIFSKAIMTGIGYKELYSYFDGECSLDDVLDKIKQNSRRYAKRQYTFFNHQLNVKWFETNYDDFNKTVIDVKNYLGGDFNGKK